MEAKGVSSKCPMCTSGELSVSVFEPHGALLGEGLAPAIRVIHELQDGSRRGYGEFLRVCLNCGYVHYIRDIEVLAFVEEGDDNG